MSSVISSDSFIRIETSVSTHNHRIKQLHVITLIISTVVIGLLTSGLFAVSSISMQLLIWIVSFCLILIAWACACYRYFLLTSSQNIKMLGNKR
ncbi:hypothetical protein [Chlamydia sp. 17-3921]|uniref:hypothetical protein n=1 Tax=Chlamydia sp. 17-3921 TaxID=2675798 RepID=UPI00191B1A17|nr:hypothetical protein [Chlamydia sp. 17-3921]